MMKSVRPALAGESVGNPVEGAVVQLSGTQNRKFITDRNGNYSFDNVETNGFYTVTPSRVNYLFSPVQRSFSQLGNNTDAAFSTTATGNALNPIGYAGILRAPAVSGLPRSRAR